MSAPARRHVAHLIDVSADTHYFRALADHHDRSRFDLSVASLAPAGPLQRAMRERGVGTRAFGRRGPARYPLAIPALRSWLVREAVDVLHLHTFYAGAVGLLAGRLAGVGSVVLTRHHSDHLLRLDRPVHHWVDRRVTRGVDHVIAVSEATRRILVEEERADPARVTVVYNGREPAELPAGWDRERTRAALGLDGRFVLVTVARLHEEKGHRHLLDALPAILAVVPETVLLLVGAGAEEEALRAQARALGLEGAVRFLGHRDDVPQVMAASDLMVLPSLAESFGFVLVEAMALGLPVVAARTGGIPEVVGEGEGRAGLVVPAADSKALAGAVLDLRRDEGLRRRLASAGPARARRFGAARMVREYEAVYDAVSAPGGGG